MIARWIRFDDRSSRRPRDKLSPIREISELINAKFKSSYNASPFITLDEQLLTFRGKCGFKMFIPSKPGKYGIKLWVLCDSTNSYYINAQVYLGKEGSSRKVRQSSRVVYELTDHLTGSGRHLTADFFFTDLTTVRTLLGRKITYTGTLRKNKGRYLLLC